MTYVILDLKLTLIQKKSENSASKFEHSPISNYSKIFITRKLMQPRNGLDYLVLLIRDQQLIANILCSVVYFQLSYVIFLGLYSYILLVKFNKDVSNEEIILIIWVFSIFAEEVRQVTLETDTVSFLWGYNYIYNHKRK